MALILDAVKVVIGPFKNLIVDRIVEYLKFIKNYDDNMNKLVYELTNLNGKKLDLKAKVKSEEANQRVMTRETGNWLRSVMDLIEREEMRQLMREERVAEIVVKMMERRVLKKLWKEDREIFDIVVDVVKNNSNHQRVGDEEVVDAEENDDYKKIAKIASDVMKDIADEFTKLLKGDDAAVAVVKLLNNVEFQNVDLEKLRKDGDEIAMILSKGEGIIRKEVGHNHDDDDEEELLIPKHDEDVQPVNNESFIKDKVKSLRKRMGRLTAFLDDENFKKSLPDGARLGLEVMNTLSNSSGSDQAVENSQLHRYCGCCIVRFEVNRRHHDMSERAVTMIKAINHVIGRYPSNDVTRPIRDDELEYIPGKFIDGLESREEVLQRILIALKNDQVNIVGLYGMGGCGKTTLAKEIAHRRTSDLFDKRVVVEVSENPSIKGIQNQIGGGIGLILDDMNTMAQRAQKLYNRLKSEKILIILDNIWKKLKLDEVGIPRESSKDFCCKLLITTREEQVCRLMDVQEVNNFKVGLLNKREALKLFENQAEKKVSSNGEFKPVADKLLGKCGGLPLAIATTASALRGKDLPMWRHFAEIAEKPIISQVSSEYRETYSILETSYKLIDNEEKRIFLFLVCLSPLDSAVTINDLVRYGIGLDLFQHVNGLSEAMEQATTWANELISSSLLLKGDSDGEVKIHDLVRASYISFINKGNDRVILVESIPRWMSQQSFKKFKAISLLSGNDFSRLSGVKAPMLQILLLKGDISSTSLPSDFFVGMKNLKILSLSNINFSSGLPESMGHLQRLKTLHLHNCKLTDVKLIGKLVNLLVLSLRGSSLEELAIEIGDLCKLRLLDIEGCKGMRYIPANILSRLSHLEGLYMLNVFDGWASTNIEVNPEEGDDQASGSELDTLSHLNALETEVREGGYDQASGSELDTLSHLNVLEMEVAEAKQLLTANNGQYVEQLGKFKIRVRNSYKWGSEECRYILELKDINTVENNWLRAVLKKADYFLVMDCPSFTENLVPLFDEEGFKDLRNLVVEKCNFKCIVSSSDQDESMVFANLEILRLNYMDNLEMICDGKSPAGLFSNLQRLIFYSLPKLKYGLPLTSIRHNLVEIEVYSCKSLEFIFNKDTTLPEDEAEIILFPYLKSVTLLNLLILSSVVGQTHSETHTIEYLSSQDRPFFDEKIKFQSLEILKLFNETIVTLWSTASDISSFQNLKNMRIIGCSKLQNLGPPSIFAALVQLEHLEIRKCKNLQEVITKETERNGIREGVIAFPQLKHLCLENLDFLERFYGGSYKLEFPKLKSLKLSFIRNLTNFDGSEISTTLFSDKIEFPCLEDLHVQRLSSEVVRLWNWSSSGVEGETESGSNPLDPVPSLQKLQLSRMQGLMSIPHFVSHKLTHLDVSDSNDIKFLFSVSPLNREVFWSYSQLSNLADLSVGGYDFVEQLFENEDDAAVVMLCERLIKIKLKAMAKMKILPWHLLSNIRTLSVSDLKWKYLFSADLFTKGREQLQQLEYLWISGCKDMKVIIMDELAGDGEDTVYCFPRLKKLELDSLNITKFVSKPNTGLHFQSLRSIEFTGCDKMHSFCSGPFRAPKLEYLVLLVCESMEYFLSDKMNVRELPCLTNVRIYGCPKMLSFSSKPLIAPKLHSVILKESGEMRWFSPGDPNCGDILELPCLERVIIEECWGMQKFSSGGINAPYLCDVMVDKQDYSKCTNEKLQELLQNLQDYHIRSNFNLPEFLTMTGNETIVTLWSTASDISSFQNLKNLDIKRCSKLQSLGPPSIFAALVQLERLSIGSCKNMQEVITKETERNGIREGVIAFPQLKHICLLHLDNLERFYGGSYKLEFPKLKSLNLSVIRNLTNFDGAEISNTLFSDKIEFPCLEDLQVEELSREVVRLWNWSSSGVEGETESGSNPLDPVPSLQKLELSSMQGLMSIPHFVSHKLTRLDVSDLNDIKFLFSVSPLNREVFWSYSQLPNLAELSVGGYDHVEQLFENEDDTSVVMLCQRLNGIYLYSMPKMKILPWHLLTNIRTLHVSYLKWKYLFSADLFTKGREQLQQLESLYISDCEDMKVIIMDELAGDGEDRVYCFPRLQKLELWFVNITKFVSKPNTGLHFQSLQSIELKFCNKMHSFCSGPFRAPKLEELKLSGCDSMEYFLCDEMNEVQELPSLTNVEIKECPKMLSFSSKPLIAPKLHSVILEKSGELRWFSPGGPNCGGILELPSLEQVIIEKCWGMQKFSSGRINAPCLCDIMVDEKDFSKWTNEKLHDLLQNLQDYHIREVVVEEEEEEEDMNDGGDEEREELRTEDNDGFQEQQITEGEGDEELEDSDRSQEEQITKGDEELKELRTEDIDGSQREQNMEGGGEQDELPATH